jgi:hypothetical protein
MTVIFLFDIFFSCFSNFNQGTGSYPPGLKGLQRKRRLMAR